MHNLWKKAWKRRYTGLAVLFWILFWQILSMIIHREIFLASPKAVLFALLRLFQTSQFWSSVFFSFGKIATGFFLAVASGVLLAVFSCMNELVKAIISVMVRLMKSIPVASFVIISLLWIDTQNLSVLIAYLMVLPVVYQNVLKGIESTDRKLLEMAKVFHMPFIRKMRYIYLPAVMPYFTTACSLGLGLCWKSGIAAELIGQPKNSIGARLYETKLYLMTKELFAWTIVIILLSVFFEKLVMVVLRKIAVLIMGQQERKE